MTPRLPTVPTGRDPAAWAETVGNPEAKIGGKPIGRASYGSFVQKLLDNPASAPLFDQRMAEAGAVGVPPAEEILRRFGLTGGVPVSLDQALVSGAPRAPPPVVALPPVAAPHRTLGQIIREYAEPTESERKAADEVRAREEAEVAAQKIENDKLNRAHEAEVAARPSRVRQTERETAK
jgi:hypothetical protein